MNGRESPPTPIRHWSSDWELNSLEIQRRLGRIGRRLEANNIEGASRIATGVLDRYPASLTARLASAMIQACVANPDPLTEIEASFDGNLSPPEIGATAWLVHKAMSWPAPGSARTRLRSIRERLRRQALKNQPDLLHRVQYELLTRELSRQEVLMLQNVTANASLCLEDPELDPRYRARAAAIANAAMHIRAERTTTVRNWVVLVAGVLAFMVLGMRTLTASAGGLEVLVTTVVLLGLALFYGLGYFGIGQHKKDAWTAIDSCPVLPLQPGSASPSESQIQTRKPTAATLAKETGKERIVSLVIGDRVHPIYVHRKGKLTFVVKGVRYEVRRVEEIPAQARKDIEQEQTAVGQAFIKALNGPDRERCKIVMEIDGQRHEFATPQEVPSTLRKYVPLALRREAPSTSKPRTAPVAEETPANKEKPAVEKAPAKKDEPAAPVTQEAPPKPKAPAVSLTKEEAAALKEVLEREADTLKVALDQGILTQDQIVGLIEEQTRRKKEGRLIPILDLALINGYVTNSDVEKILLESKRSKHEADDRFGKEGWPFGPYMILKKLGEGAMGAVFLARPASDPNADLIALKVMSAALSNDPDLIERFKREARIVMKFTHPNLVRGFDFGSADSRFYYAMEFVEGTDLSELIKGHKYLLESRTLDITIDICRALKALAENELVHRDVKPSNILIAKDGTAKLTDAGLAKSVAQGAPQLTRGRFALGTPHYMSPEQINSDPDIDIRSDLYSLGATMYALLTGRAPFKGASVHAVMLKQLADELDDPHTFRSHLSKQMAQIMKKAMAVDKNQRYQTPDDLLEDLTRVRAGLPPQFAHEVENTEQEGGGSSKGRGWVKKLFGSRNRQTPPG